MSKVKLMTQAEYATHRGCSGVAVFKAVKAGRISLIEGKIDPVVADLQWQANTRVRASGRMPTQSTMVLPIVEEPAIVPPTVQGQGASTQPAQDDGYMQNRARREAADADMAEMKLAEMRGRLLQKQAVEAAIFEIARAMRDGLTNCSRRIAADVSLLSGVEACEAIIDREHRALLETMTHSLTAKLGADAAAE